MGLVGDSVGGVRRWFLGGLVVTLFGCGSSVVIYGSGEGGGGADEPGGQGGTVTFPGTSTTTGNGGTPIPSTGVTTGTGGQGAGGEGAGGEICATVAVETTVDKAPADVVFVVDNSGSMSEEIDAVEQNINVNFANVMAAAELDYRVIMMTRTTAPRSARSSASARPSATTNDCSEGPPGIEPPVRSTTTSTSRATNSLCVVLETLNGGGLWADQQGLNTPTAGSPSSGPRR